MASGEAAYDQAALHTGDDLGQFLPARLHDEISSAVLCDRPSGLVGRIEAQQVALEDTFVYHGHILTPVAVCGIWSTYGQPVVGSSQTDRYFGGCDLLADLIQPGTCAVEDHVIRKEASAEHIEHVVQAGRREDDRSLKLAADLHRLEAFLGILQVPADHAKVCNRLFQVLHKNKPVADPGRLFPVVPGKFQDGFIDAAVGLKIRSVGILV